MKKSLLSAAIVATGIAAAPAAQATLAEDAVLLMGPQTEGCPFGVGTAPACSYGAAFPTGNYFAMDTNGDGFTEAERTGIKVGADGGIKLGVSAANAQTGTTEDFTTPGLGSIDETWNFFTNPGNHIHGGTLDVVDGTNTIDMNGWTVFWGNPANGGIDPSGNVTRGPIDMGTGAAAIVTCSSVDCAVGDTFELDYSAVVPSGGFSGVAYQLHLSGMIGAGAAVPVPAAVWLFGSGLLGLVGVARRKKHV